MLRRSGKATWSLLGGVCFRRDRVCRPVSLQQAPRRQGRPFAHRFCAAWTGLLESKALVLLDGNVKGRTKGIGFALQILGPGLDEIDEGEGNRLVWRHVSGCGHRCQKGAIETQRYLRRQQTQHYGGQQLPARRPRGRW